MTAEIKLRHPEPGDAGWIVQRHGAVYAAEYGFDERFEGLVAQLLGNYLSDHDPERERLWIAELNGRPVGSIMLVCDDKVERPMRARLRILLVEPEARGHGLGKRLVHECVRFARDAGYEDMVLTTVSALSAARKLYENEGFRIYKTEAQRSWSQDLVFEEWEMEL